MKITKGTRVFLTGAASGIGRATAVALAEKGCHLFLTDINEDGLQNTCDMISSKGFPRPVSRALDITDLAALQSFAEEIQAQHGAMGIIMNIAGVALFARFEDMTHAHWQKVININLWGPLHGLECFLPAMIKAGRGHIVNVASVAGLFGLPWHGAYSTSKFGLVGLSEVLKNDLQYHNIKVTVVCPGAVNTEIKQSVELIGLDRESAKVQKIMARFEKHALSPEAVAKKMIRAIEAEKFLLLTSVDMKLFYFIKRYLPPLYNLIMRFVSHQFEKIAKKE